MAVPPSSSSPSSPSSSSSSAPWGTRWTSRGGRPGPAAAQVRRGRVRAAPCPRPPPRPAFPLSLICFYLCLYFYVPVLFPACCPRGFARDLPELRPVRAGAVRGRNGNAKHEHLRNCRNSPQKAGLNGLTARQPVQGAACCRSLVLWVRRLAVPCEYLASKLGFIPNGACLVLLNVCWYT